MNTFRNRLLKALVAGLVVLFGVTELSVQNVFAEELAAEIPVVIHSFPLDTDPGWQTQGLWEFGQPQGIDGDPSSGYTGANVYGYNLAGKYPNNMSEYWLTTSILDCSGYTNVTLRFKRWLGVEVWVCDKAELQASTNGVDWTPVWSHTGGSQRPASWTEVSYDISNVADDQAAIYVRWGMGRTDGSVTYCGWNIDDVEILGSPAFIGELSVVIPANASETDGVLTGTGMIYIDTAFVSNLTVYVESSDSSEVLTTNSVIIPAGQTNAAFDITIQDDADLDGSQTAAITASLENYKSGSGEITVHDNETATLTLSLPQTTFEGAGMISGALQVNRAPDADILVELSSNNTNKVGNATVMIPAGQTFVSFSLPVFDNTEIDGVQTATIEAQVRNWTGSRASVFIFDNELTGIQLNLPASVNESDSVLTNAGSVVLPGTVLVDAHVLLTASDTTEITLPAFVTVPAGTNRVEFDITVVDDAEADGTQQLSVLAESPGYIPALRTLDVTDNELHHLTVEISNSNPDVMDPVTIEVSAKTIDDLMISDYSGSVNLTASGDAGNVPVEPAVLAGFSDGVASGDVTFGRVADNATLVADAGAGVQGTSTVFSVMGSIINISPAAMTNTSVIAGQSVIRTMVISNAGNADLEFEIKGTASDEGSTLTEGLMASYPFNGNADDESGNGHDGTVNGATLTIDRFGNADSAYEFDGVNDYIDLGTMGGFKTVSMWIRQEARSDYDFYFGHTDFRLYATIIDSGKLSLGDGAGSLGSTVHMDNETGQWHHVVATSDGTSSKLYFNGVNVTASPRVLALARNAAVNLGRWTGGTHYFHGAMDDVRIYDRVLSESEIAGLFNESEEDDGPAPSGSNLIVNGDFEAGNTDFSSEHTYSESSDLSPGAYYVGPSPWPAVGDHTSSTGKMLIWKEGLESNKIIWQQEVLVSSGKTYNFSAWIWRGLYHPNVEFKVNGTSVGSLQETLESGWREFSSEWEASTSEPVTLSIVNTIVPPPFFPSRNVFAIDDVSFQPVGGGEPNAPDEGLVAHYPFNGNADDESGNGHDGTVNGATLTADRFGNADSAYRFDGVNDIIVVPDHDDFTVTDVSVAAWIRTTDKSDYKHITSCYGTGYYSDWYHLHLRSGSGLAAWQTDSGGSLGVGKVEGTTDIADGDWHLLVGVRDTSTTELKIYVDGVFQNSISAPDNSALNPEVNLWIGGQNSFATRYFNGDIDDVRIYNRALSAYEIAAIYSLENPVEPPAAASWLSANPISGTVAPGSNITVSVTFDAADMEAGESPNTTLRITCNDVLSPTNDVPVSMQVINSGDPDGDAIADVWKQLYFGEPAAFSPLLDADGDGLNNQGEYIAGTNPTDADSRFSVSTVQTQSGDGFVLTWNSVTGRVYSVYWKRGLGEDFQPLETGIEYPQNSYTDTVHSAEGCGFYKVTVDLAPAAADQQ